LAGDVDRRTMERWRKKEAVVPAATVIEALEKKLGGPTGHLLRWARVAACLRRDLIRSVGKPMLDDWRAAVRQVAQTSARRLRDPSGIASFLSSIADGLGGAVGDDCVDLQSLPTGSELRGAHETIRQLRQCAARFEAAAHSSVHRHALAHLSRLVFNPEPQLYLVVGADIDWPSMVTDVQSDLAVQVRIAWDRTMLLRRLTTGGQFGIPQADGTLQELVIGEPVAGLAARRLEIERRFLPVEDEPFDEAEAQEIQRLIEAVLPGGPSLASMQNWAAHELLLGSRAANIEPQLPDEIVLRGISLSAQRARRLAEAGQFEDALPWLNHCLEYQGPIADHVSEDIYRAAVAQAHSILDGLRQIRNEVALARAKNDGTEEAGVGDLLQQFDSKFSTFLQRGWGPPGSNQEVSRLALLIPVLMRLDIVTENLDLPDRTLPSAEDTVQDLRQSLLDQPAHGLAWAALALWDGVHDQSSTAAKHAVHYGHGADLERERERLRLDRVLS